jgi:hypothetical protein
MRRVVVEASFVDASKVAELCAQTGGRLEIPAYEGPFVHPIVNDDLVGPVPERVWAIVEHYLLARGASLDSQVVPKRAPPSVLVVHRSTRTRSSLIAAFGSLGATAVGMVATNRALEHLRAIGADMLVTGPGGESLITIARAKSDRLRVCALVGAQSEVADLAFENNDADAIAREMLARWR